MTKLLTEFPDVFPEDLPDSLPPKREIAHEIRLKDSTQDPPFRQCYKLSQAEMKELQE